jgi:hypothetical protein
MSSSALKPVAGANVRVIWERVFGAVAPWVKVVLPGLISEIAQGDAVRLEIPLGERRPGTVFKGVERARGEGETFNIEISTKYFNLGSLG